MAASGGLSETASRALDAYGGAERWRAAQAVEASVSFSGLLFTIKLNRPPRRLAVRCELDRPYARLEPLDRKGTAGVLDGQDVRLEDAGGKVLEERSDARSLFPGGRRRIRWDTLDQTYFMGYVCWNYLALPAHLLRDDFGWKELEPGVLDANPERHLPVHSYVERYYFDAETGLQTRLDFTVDLMSPHAAAASRVKSHATNGIPYVSHHRVTPRKGPEGDPLPLPTMVNVRVSDWKLI